MLAGFFLLAAVSALLVALMTRLGTLDHPGERSSHETPTPKGGGIGIVAAFVFGILVYLPLTPTALGLIAASLVLAVVSYFDDLYDWPFTVKLAAQLAAAIIAVCAGIRTPDFSQPIFGIIDPAMFSAALTVLWLGFATNAVNFIDGLNGLASGSVALACLILAGFAHFDGDPFVMVSALAVAAGIAGFLPFNFPKARIFMGDVGSQVCGFVSAALGIAAVRHGDTGQELLRMPLLLFGIYADVIFTLVRRACGGERLTQAHRSHLYQIAQRSGIKSPAVSLLYWAMVVWGGGVCLAGTLSHAGWSRYTPLAVLPPWIAWLIYVQSRAKRMGLPIW